MHRMGMLQQLQTVDLSAHNKSALLVTANSAPTGIQHALSMDEFSAIPTGRKAKPRSNNL